MQQYWHQKNHHHTLLVLASVLQLNLSLALKPIVLMVLHAVTASCGLLVLNKIHMPLTYDVSSALCLMMLRNVAANCEACVTHVMCISVKV